MQTAHLHLIKFALKQGHVVSVHDGEEWAVKKSSSYKAIKDAVDSVEESELVIRTKEGEKLGWAHIIDQGTPDETVSNYTVTPFMDAWDELYNQHCEGV